MKENKKYVAECDMDFLEELRTLSEEMGSEKFIAMMRRASEKGRKVIIRDAIKRGLFSKREYKNKFKDKYNDSDGLDSFSQYIGTVLHVMDSRDETLFVTSNDNLLRDWDMLKNRFGVKILNVEEASKDKEQRGV
ncbi:unnamed protein product [marine sediment metagenome]|uniref:Uncharacterized protein n=1 Tax=marine sediment metagenome TaxID=412755 RepID=X1KPF5_9ZZZZ